MINEINRLRYSLIEEAQNSPMLLSDLAGLEAYVSESYNCRSFIELLQNADDAGATSFIVKRVKSYILVANNGRPFNIKDLESLCRSASSNKLRGSSIGYRGIGFKSVVSFATEVHLVSGDFEITFSKKLSKELIPQASKIPLIRIPHPILQSVKEDLSSEISKMQNESYSTIFIFSGVAANQIDDEYTNFASTTLLFLNSIKDIRIELGINVSANISAIDKNEKGQILRISTMDSYSDWYVCSEKNCSIAFSVEKGNIYRLSKTDAIIHAFLPTEDICGLGVIVNGDFSTDPSRRHLILDDTTNEVIVSLAKLYISLLRFALENDHSDMADALLPYYDVSLIQLMKQSFEKEFTILIKNVSGEYFSKIKIAPNWFNAVDYTRIMKAANYPFISVNCNSLKGLTGLVKYLGSRNGDVDSILQKVNGVEISVLGYAQIAGAGINSILMNNCLSTFETTALFISRSKLYSLKEINDREQVIDESFLELIKDQGLSQRDIEVCLKKLSLVYLQEHQFEEGKEHTNVINSKIPKNSASNWFDGTSLANSNVNSLGVQRWRSAEENARNALNANGFRLRDVSKQNVGYDLEGKDPNDNEIFIEVKSVDFAGQKFRMTNNEFAAAQYKQDRYYLAIVLQSANTLEISLVKNPIQSLNMVRQCVQWVWECTDYEYNPMIFNI